MLEFIRSSPTQFIESLAIHHWLFITGYSSLAIHHWLFITGYSSLAIHRWLFITG
jgi:hypothetical protein